MRRIESPRRWKLWFVLGAIAVFAFFFNLILPKPGPTVPVGPVVLKEVRDLGELRTVSHHASRVFEYESHRQPEGWSEHVPFAREVLAAATSNKVLVSAEGDIQAGVDLTRAEVKETANSIEISLPAVEVFEPVVKLQVHNQKDGVFWRDLNIVGKAEEEVAGDMIAAAKSAGIQERAEKNVEETLSNLVEGISDKPVKVTFSPN